jgi:hypothetical protein
MKIKLGIPITISIDGKQNKYELDTSKALLNDSSINNDLICYLKNEALKGNLLHNSFYVPEEKACPEYDKYLVFSYWLNWVQSDNNSNVCGSSLPFWIFNKKGHEARDTYLIRLLKSIDSKVSLKEAIESSNKKFKDIYLSHKIPWSFYQDHFFYWYLRRYHLPYARAIYGIPITSNYYILCLMLITSFISIGWNWNINLINVFIMHNTKYQLLPIIQSYGDSVLLIITYCSILFYLCCRVDSKGKMPLINAIHSLIPRLAATSVVGYLFLVSANSMVEYIVTKVDNRSGWIAVLVLLLGSGIYFGIEMAHRIRPLPSFRDCLLRMSNVIATGFMHACFIFSLGYPILKFYGQVPVLCYQQKILLIMIILSIGIVLNIVWEENPVTEPL